MQPVSCIKSNTSNAIWYCAKRSSDRKKVKFMQWWTSSTHRHRLLYHAFDMLLCFSVRVHSVHHTLSSTKKTASPLKCRPLPIDFESFSHWFFFDYFFLLQIRGRSKNRVSVTLTMLSTIGEAVGNRYPEYGITVIATIWFHLKIACFLFPSVQIHKLAELHVVYLFR